MVLVRYRSSGLCAKEDVQSILSGLQTSEENLSFTDPQSMADKDDGGTFSAQSELSEEGMSDLNTEISRKNTHSMLPDVLDSH